MTPSPLLLATAGLLQQLGDFLLDAVGLSQGGDAGLRQDLVLGQGCGGGGVVRGLDCVLCRGDVLLLRGNDLRDSVECVDLRAEIAALCCYVADGRVEGRLRPGWWSARLRPSDS
jgi:hypothetical protein